MARDEQALGLVSAMIETAAWKALREEAMKKVASHEESVKRLLFRTRSPVDPVEIEYSRGFYQGVIYVLDGLPNTMKAEFEKLLRDEGVKR